MVKKNSSTYKRVLDAPTRSFFLFGPRGTGKSTWFHQQKKLNAVLINLLNSEVFLQLYRNPASLEEKLYKCKKGDWVWIDEIQKIPMLLDEVHRLIEDRGLNFGMTGSSARKLKRGGANLLAGRAITKDFEGLVYSEFGRDWDINKIIQWGCLPFLHSNKIDPKEYLSDYLNTYLKEEIREESLVRKIDPFFRFLEIAGLLNGQKINASNISREAGVPRASVDIYYEILRDTLIVHFLPGFQPRVKIRESILPKIYWFDPGVARAAAGLLFEDFDSVWGGFALETYFFHELRIYNSTKKRGRKFYYYQTPSGKEIDFIIETKKGNLNTKPEVICIEVKLSKKWKSEWNAEMEALQASDKIKVKKCYGVFNGNESLKQGNVEILPVKEFLQRLWDDKVF